MPMVTPLAWPQDFKAFGSGAELIQNSKVWNEPQLLSLMTRATRHIETRCDRRLAPFSGVTETTRADGVASDGVANDDVPLDLRSALGRAQSMAYGATDLVRDFWLAQYAPVYQDQWFYTVESIDLVTIYGADQSITVATIEGPEADTGHLRLQLGTFCPPGTTVRIKYSGGYSTVPDDLQLACIFQATKFLLLGAEPETRDKMSAAELDAEILTLIASYIRY